MRQVEKAPPIAIVLRVLFSAGVIALFSALAYLQIVNSYQSLERTLPLKSALSSLKQAIDRNNTPIYAQKAINDILGKDNAYSLKRLLIVIEPSSTKYRFLRKRKFYADSQHALVGKSLDKQKAFDKILYDLASKARKRTRLAKKSNNKSPSFSFEEAKKNPNDKIKRFAVQALIKNGKHWATAIAIGNIKEQPIPQSAKPIGIGLIIVLCLSFIISRMLPKYDYQLVFGLIVAYAATIAWLLVSLNNGYHQLLFENQSHQHLSELSNLEPSYGMFILGLFLGFFFYALAFLGIGKKVFAALKEHRLAYTLLLPTALGMLILVLVPFSYGLGLGFFNHHHGEYHFVGLNNFIDILSGDGRPITHPLNFYFTLGVTILWTALNVFLHVAIGLGLAMLLKNPLLRFRGIYRALLILPWAMPNYITALIWKGMFHYQYGAVNTLLEAIGIERISWFSNFSTAFFANVVTNTWLGFPFMMVVSLGALQSIPSNVYEAAAVDGASKKDIFFRITLPLLRPALYPAIVLGSIWTFNMFNIIYLVSEGGPNGSTDILITEAYRWAFERGDRYGLAAAYALIIFVILWGYSKVANKLAGASEDL